MMPVDTVGAGERCSCWRSVMSSMGVFLKRMLCAAPTAFLWTVAALAQQTPPDAAAPAAAAAATSALNTGDTAWMLTSVALVLMMTIPGLPRFDGGMVRKMYVLATVMQSVAVTCLVTVLWTVVTYSMAFTPGSPFVGGMSRFLLMGMTLDSVNDLAKMIPESVYMCFQMTFAIITPALICGAFADRMKFSALLWFIGLWAVFVYAQIATATAALAWMFAEWIVKGKPSVLGIISGAVAGLVAITPASGFVDPRGALIIGIAAGVICYWATTGLKHAFGYDDSLDVFGVHGVGGATGALLAGVLAGAWVGGEGKSGLIDGNPPQVLTQLYGIGVVALYDAIASLILLKLVDLTIGLRVESDIEREGLDLAIHGEAVQ